MKKVVVQHGFYGCESGCCGTEILAIEIVNGEEYERKREFKFDDPDLETAKDVAENHVKKYWPEWVGAPIEIGDLRCPAA